ncbi:MAG: NAD(P)/FAD-dependent oxidoreductase [Acidimicrobiales bacterium]|jgi:pyruvate/2-oxoglutarate dehydrogenase complex dihydrolipoamide dehydrogenase (E3) component
MADSASADVVVVGMGPGGEDVAGRLAERGLEVVGIESNLVGGECPYWGCVPSKMMIRASNLLAEARRLPGISGSCTVLPDWEPVARRIREDATDDWNDQVAVDRFKKKGGHFVRGRGRLVGPGEVAVDGQHFGARKAVVLATGARSWSPPIPGLSDVPYWTNREAIEATELPRSLVIVGGGAIAVELGQVFARFGVDVSIVEVAERLLPLEEPEAGDLLEGVLRAEGVVVLTGAQVTGVSHDGASFELDLAGRELLRSERLLVAAGRRPDLSSLGVDTIGFDPTTRFLPTDDHLRVAPGIWAVGDVTGVGAFTHVSMYQASIAVADILGDAGPVADYRALPRVTFTDPEIGSVGLSEEAARSRGISVRTGVAQIPSSVRGWIHKAGNEGLIKLVEDEDRGVLVGALSAGPVGGEVLGLLTLAVHAKVSTGELRTMIYAYPTFHRAIEAALVDLED